MELVGSLAEKKLPTEGYIERNGEREKSSGQKKIPPNRDYKECTLSEFSFIPSSSQSSTRVCVRICVSIRRPEFEVDRSWRDLSSSAVDRSWRDPSSSMKVCGSRCELGDCRRTELRTGSSDLLDPASLEADANFDESRVSAFSSIRQALSEISFKFTAARTPYAVRYYTQRKCLLSKNLKVRIYKTIILPVVLYGCETWTLTLREKQRLRVFENKVLRKIFVAKRDEVTGEWRKLHNVELHALYASPDIIGNIKSRRLTWAGHVACMGESRNGYRVLVGRSERKRPLGSPRRRWEDNIKMDLIEVGYDDRDWINLAQDRDRWRAYVRAAMRVS
ncbi:hypothetical protein ANN_11377 [Periplaneta americana]|uniref:Endonuclease-reverse transcriptase n=1 Tax=Periplaneta americana TaxID=6978 RepID=A0ABQ8T4V2_PERAM|nr:hypothetical protein ANN_11377 [Periplaneta americana]